MISDRENVKQEGSPGIRVRDSRDRPLNFPSNLDVHDRRDAGAMPEPDRGNAKPEEASSPWGIPLNVDYVFVDGLQKIKDPCSKLNCSQGAQCVRSRDGTEASCECLQTCPNLGDHEGSGPVCGTDGIDYPTLCDLNKGACAKGANISVAFRGKCGK
ncbi:hypothetical protein HZH68_006469 [Vespula germanica]|uniref:Kazal-like domain-containing protein n=1 Tax=Vespula germanica TaxID=30212 RepID=A0A834KBU7_VESGE|nr:hypothetical protein HZH68_006469 [Vespula germanica]